MANLVALAAFASLALVQGDQQVPKFGPDFKPTDADNMNGEYVLSTTPGGKEGLFPKQYKDYPGGVEYYEAYTPAMTTLYSQVWWKPLAPAPFPAEMVKKYAGKNVAIVGWEIDQVRRTPQGDVSVPISATYNHHYVSQFIGADAEFEKVTFDGPNDPRAVELAKKSGHGMIAWDQPHYIVKKKNPESSSEGKPVHETSSSANGGEYRKSFHGYAPGYAMVLHSPTSFQVTPMQIDTWNRAEMNISGPFPPKFVPGPLPRASEAPENPEYSGLLECPMTTRLTKQIDGAYILKNQGLCDEPILTFQECFQAAATAFANGGHSFINSTGSDATRPAGCSVTVDSVAKPLSIQVYFNKLSKASVTCGSKATTLVAAVDSVIFVEVQATGNDVQITLRGPSDVWFGAGFGAQAMNQMPWTVVVSGGTNSNVSEYKLANHAAGTLIKPSVKVVSNEIVNGVRTVVLTRPSHGAGPDYYTFNLSSSAMVPIITAVGNKTEYSYHQNKGPSQLVFSTVSSAGAGSCVCPEAPKPFGQVSGSLLYHPVANQSADIGSGAVAFKAGKCRNAPYTDLIEQRNPTCDIRHYQGGQWACHHMWSLLDADQEIPWTDQPLVFHHKWRFWVQPYVETYHKPVHYGFGTELLLGSPYEYDVPKCAEGVAGCSVENGTWVHTISGSTYGKYNFVAMNFHCHAPTCLSMEVYKCPMGTPLNLCNATNGELFCRQEPVYGGTGAPKINGSRFDEPGYIAIPDCVWGDAQFGLESPPNLTNVPLHMIKRSNATWGHYGEMAGGQPFVV